GPGGLRRFWPRKLSGLLAGPRSLPISALRSRLDQRQNRQQRDPFQYFNSLLDVCPRQSLPEKRQLAKIRPSPYSCHGFCCKAEEACAMLGYRGFGLASA